MCLRRKESLDVYFYLNLSYFDIMLTEIGKYEVFGNFRVGDLEYFFEYFKCSCFSRMICKEIFDVKNV